MISTTRARDKLWVVTVNWNQPKLTEQCIKSINDSYSNSLEIVIVDNGSSDNSVEFFKQELPYVNLISLNNNLGFAQGFNHGIKHALSKNADYIFMVNNDTIACSNMLDILVKFSKDSNCFISAPAIYYAENPDKLWSVGGNFNKLLSAPINAHRRRIKIPKEPTKRGFLTGCALFLNSNVFENIGFFDEKFFLYYEDLDFFFRAKQNNIDAWLVPEAKLLHYVSASSKSENSEILHYWMGVSSRKYMQKHLKFWQWFFVLPWKTGHIIKKVCVLLFNGHKKAAKAYLSGLLMNKKTSNEK